MSIRSLFRRQPYRYASDKLLLSTNSLNGKHVKANFQDGLLKIYGHLRLLKITTTIIARHTSVAEGNNIKTVSSLSKKSNLNN